jgi:murein L,D-transpeptidase YcbB/YkuD
MRMRHFLSALISHTEPDPVRPRRCCMAAGNEVVGKQIEQIIMNGESNIGSLDDDERLIQVFTYYADRSFKPIWVRDDGPKSKGKVLLDFLENIENHGLREFKYRVDAIRDLKGDNHPRALAEMEMLLTSAFIDLARDLTRGRVDPSEVSKQNNIPLPREYGSAYLLDGAEKADETAALSRQPDAAGQALSPAGRGT